MNIEDERRGKWAVLLSNCPSRHMTLYRFHQIQIELLIGELYNQVRCDRHSRQLYGSVAGNSGDVFFSPLVFASLWFYVPNFIFLRKWRQWRSVRRTLIYGHGGHLGQRTLTILAIFCSPYLRRLHMKFEQNWPRGSRGGLKFWTFFPYKCIRKQNWP